VVLEKLSLIARHWNRFCGIDQIDQIDQTDQIDQSDQDDFLETGLQPWVRHGRQLDAGKTTGQNPD
jgi:hypothetical protein